MTFVNAHDQLSQKFLDQGEFFFTESVEGDILTFRPFTLLSISPFIQACQALGLSIRVYCGQTYLVRDKLLPSKEVILLTGHFRQISWYDQESGRVRIEPGVTPQLLNQTFAQEGWMCPLEMASAGVAGMAGCLSTQAKGYHQTSLSFYRCFSSAKLIDWSGKSCELSAEHLCGTEGNLGVIVELELQLIRKPAKRLAICIKVEWLQILAHLTLLQQTPTLVSLVWSDEDKELFYLVLQGEEWRVKAAWQCIQHLYPQAILLRSNWILWIDPPQQSLFTKMQVAVPLKHLMNTMSLLYQLCDELKLACDLWVNILESSLHFILTSSSPELFATQVEEFLKRWSCILEDYQGCILHQSPFERGCKE